MAKRLLFIMGIILFSGNVYSDGKYSSAEIRGSINTVNLKHISNVIDSSNSAGHDFILLSMDSHGGIIKPTEKIVKKILNSEIPVITYISPKGAKASGSSFYIIMSSHIAVGSPGSSVGYISLVNRDYEFFNKHVETYLKAVNMRKDREMEPILDILRSGYGMTMADAVKFKVVDYVAGNKNDVLKYLHRRPVRVGNRDVIINTENIAEVHHEMSIYYSVLNFFADPEIFILLVIIVFINTILLIAAYIASLVKRNFNFMNKLTLAGMVLFSISVVMIVLIVV